MALATQYQHYIRNDGAGPHWDAAAVTPHDTNELARCTRALWVGGAGDLQVRMLSGAVVTLVAVPAGTRIDLAVVGVNDTGTDATLIVALF